MKPTTSQLDRIITMLSYQFPGLNIHEVLGKEINIEISRKTNRVKSIIIINNDTSKLLFSLRTSDGRFLPTFDGGLRIISSGYDKQTIVISDEASKFVAEGKSVYCKHIISADQDIVPQSEVFVLNQKGELLAVGTAIQPGYAMIELNSGIAVKPKHYRKSKKNR